MIAVCLLTCGREDLTAMCAQSFSDWHEDRRDLLRLHCDGGSETDENVRIAHADGFKTLIAPPAAQRIGQMATCRVFVDAVVKAGIPWILWLENDWETVAEIPTADWLASCGARTVRMFGALKFHDGPRAKAGEHKIHTKEKIDWRPDLPGWERGRAHWCAGGTLIQTAWLRTKTHLKTLKDAIVSDVNLDSLRPTTNLMWCHGHQTTAGVIG